MSGVTALVSPLPHHVSARDSSALDRLTVPIPHAVTAMQIVELIGARSDRTNCLSPLSIASRGTASLRNSPYGHVPSSAGSCFTVLFAHQPSKPFAVHTREVRL